VKKRSAQVADVRFIDATRVFRGMWKPAVDSVALEVRSGELMVLTGASGSGKSTLLRMLAGLEPLDRGRILIDGQDIARVAPDKRGVSLLAQGFALFPHLTVAENIAFPLTMRKVSAKTAGARVGQFAELCGLAGHLGARPDTLTVDLRQRAIMARAMVTKPRVICLDEPLAGASVPVMLRDRTPIATLQRESGITMLYATCSSTDARAIADRIAVLDRGVLHQVDTPHTVFEQPGTVAVAEFVGAPPMNLIPAVVAEGTARIGDLNVPIRADQRAALVGDQVIVGLRPDDLLVGAAGAGIRATAVLVKDSGREYLVHARIEVPGGTADVVLRHTAGPVPVLGEAFVVGVAVERAHLFDAATGKRLPA
jgi:multiple sugar transport system ATP-binding protein